MAGGRPGEFELIERYFRPLATESGALRLLDDAAILRAGHHEDLVLTVDLIAEGVHFLPEDPPASIAQKALRVNLSDLSAKGAIPAAYLLALALPADWTEEWIAGFAAGLAEDQKRYGIALFGGDTSRASGGLTISITAIGRVPAGTMVQRSGARPGDRIFVSGTVGDSALGLGIRIGRFDRTAIGAGAGHLLDRYLHPQPRIDLAPVVRTFASASIDVSDGLVGDLAHVCRASGVSAKISADEVPLSDAARAALTVYPDALATILSGGDDYEILAAVPIDNASTFVETAKSAGVPVADIGCIVEGRDPPVVLGASGEVVQLQRSSHVHF